MYIGTELNVSILKPNEIRQCVSMIVSSNIIRRTISHMKLVVGEWNVVGNVL